MANGAECVANVLEVTVHSDDLRVVVAGGEGGVGDCQQTIAEGLHAAVGGIDIVADGIFALACAVVQGDILQAAFRDLRHEVVGGTDTEGA